MKFKLPFKFGKSKREESAPEEGGARPKPEIQITIEAPGPSTGSLQTTGPDSWRESDAHMELLSEFRRFLPLDFYHTYTGDHLALWEKLLGESVESAVIRFIKNEMIEKVNQIDLMSYKYTVAKLKPLLRERGLKVSGRKAGLIDRLFEADPEGMNELLKGTVLCTCSEQGRALVDGYQERVQSKRETAERTAYEALCQGKLDTACYAISHFEAGQVFPRGMGINWANYVPKRDISLMRRMFKLKLPELLGDVAKDDLLRLAIAAAMMHLLGERESRWLWDVKDIRCGHLEDGDVAARMMWSQAQHATSRVRPSGKEVTYVSVLTANDSYVCERCRLLAEKPIPVEQAPPLPFKHCTSPHGCRCWSVRDRQLFSMSLTSVGVDMAAFEQAEIELENEWGHRPQHNDVLWRALHTAKGKAWGKSSIPGYRYHDKVLKIDLLLAEIMEGEGRDPAQLLEDAHRSYNQVENSMRTR